MDLYFVNSGTADFYASKRPLENALYRNNKDGSFTDVTRSAGVAGGGFGMGAFAADYDGDGDLDLAVARYDSTASMYVTQVFRNDNGVFTDINAGLPGFAQEVTRLGSASGGVACPLI